MRSSPYHPLRHRRPSPSPRSFFLLTLTLFALIAFLPRPARSLRGLAAHAAPAEPGSEAAGEGEGGDVALGAAGKVRSKLEAAKKKAWGGADGAVETSLKKSLAEAAKARGWSTKSVSSGSRRAKRNKDADVSDLKLAGETPEDAARMVMGRIGRSVEDRMAGMFEKATSAECRALIGEHFGFFVNAMGVEVSMPFREEQFHNDCEEVKYDFDNLPEGVSIGEIQNRVYQPNRNETEYLDDPKDLQLLYAVLTHDNPNATIRLIEALHEDGYTFVVHVDGKESSDSTFDALVAYASIRDYVHVLGHPHRVRVNWGGFSMVNATLQILHYTFALEGSSNVVGPLEFHKFVHIASTSYPIRSNSEIRRRIASYPLDANMLNVVMKPNRPGPSTWHYFVECDDALHRIYRLTPLVEDNYGIDIYTSSQWFIISRDFSEYIALAEPGTLAEILLEYVEHVVVADETFFGTLLRHSPFCGMHHNDNFLHLQFDRWENELGTLERDPKKCIMPDPNHCGRSPTTMTLDYLPNLELSGSLFARKFLDDIDSEVKDVLDMKRAREEELFKSSTHGGPVQTGPDTSFEGNGVLIVARETVNETTPLCLGLGDTQNKVRLVPCFNDWVVQTLAEGWETGAVIEDETHIHNRWNLGPCSSDGSLERVEDGQLNMTPGRYSTTGPSCLLTQLDGLRAGRCLDSESDRLQPGGKVHVYPCIHRWNQFFSIGNGFPTPRGSIHTNVPKHIKKRIESRGKTQELYLCLGVEGRGEVKEDDWEVDRGKSIRHDLEVLPNATNEQHDSAEIEQLNDWSGKQLVAIPCSNDDAVIEWLFIPYIVEVIDENESGEIVDGNMFESSQTSEFSSGDEEEEEL